VGIIEIWSRKCIRVVTLEFGNARLSLEKSGYSIERLRLKENLGVDAGMEVSITRHTSNCQACLYSSEGK